MQASADPYRSRLYRLVFALAALYNIGLGLWAILTPNSFFDLFQLQRPRYPAVWSTLGMVLGLYGIAYAYAAVRLDRAAPFIAIGLAGKILGPAGWIAAIHSGELPLRTFALIAFDDIVWWLPFALFLLEGTSLGQRVRRLAPYACAGVNLLAAAVLALVLSQGLTAGDVATRSRFVLEHGLLWRTGWGLWIAAGVTLVAFYAWWGARIRKPGLALAAVGIAVAGLALDLAAESLFIGWLPQDFETITRTGTVLTGGAANGLYTVAGVLLTLGTPTLRGPVLLWTWAIWAAGCCLSLFALTGLPTGIAVSTGVLFVLFCPWAAAMRWQLP